GRAFQESIGRAGQARFKGIAHGEKLHATDTVGTAVGGRPGARNDFGAAAVGRDRIAVADRHGTTGILRGGHASGVGAGVGGAFQDPVWWTGNDRFEVSCTVMVCTQLALLPQASVAVQVRAISLVAPQLLLVTSL